MRILHTGDWHLGKKLGRFSRLEEQREVMAEIVEIADNEKADAVLLAGDIYDVSQPSAAAMDLLGQTMERLSDGGRRPVLAVAGNHDSPALVDAQRYFAQKLGVLFYGYPDSEIRREDAKIVEKSAPGFVEILVGGVPLRVLTTPYANELTLGKFMENEREERINAALHEIWSRNAEKFCDENGVNLLLTHLFFQPATGVKPQEPDAKEERSVNYVGGSCAVSTLNVPGQIQFCAVGHLHRYQILDGKAAAYGRNVPVVYSGSPLAYSMSEAGQEKCVLMLELQPGLSPEWKPVALTKGRRLTRIHALSVEEALEKMRRHPEDYVEITLKRENPLSTTELNEIRSGHAFITDVIPVHATTHSTQAAPDSDAFHKLSIVEHFVKYYEHKHKTPPDQETLDIFIQLATQE